jgi:chemotaxis protein CheZ
MGEPRKIFRIEEAMAGARRHAPGGDAPAPEPPQLADILQELSTLRALLAAGPAAHAPSRPVQHDDVERLAANLRAIRSTIAGAEPDRGDASPSRPQTATATRIASELQAVMKGSEQATQKILAAAEDIDQAANNLSALVKGDAEHGLAQDIRDRVIAIFEACNFQDLTSQRVAKVMAALDRIEAQIARTLEDHARDAAPAMHGPRLPDDHGHASQSDVDSMFGGAPKSAAAR